MKRTKANLILSFYATQRKPVTQTVAQN